MTASLSSFTAFTALAVPVASADVYWRRQTQDYLEIILLHWNGIKFSLFKNDDSQEMISNLFLPDSLCI